jgi:fructose-1-phosphate kinase PfkB-like protein
MTLTSRNESYFSLGRERSKAMGLGLDVANVLRKLSTTTTPLEPAGDIPRDLLPNLVVSATEIQRQTLGNVF